MAGLCLIVKLHREGSAPAACAAGLFPRLEESYWHLREEPLRQLLVVSEAVLQADIEEWQVAAPH